VIHAYLLNYTPCTIFASRVIVLLPILRLSNAEEHMTLKSFVTRTGIRAIGLAAAFASLAAAQSAPPFYTITDLGAVGASPGQVLILTNNGLVSGATVNESANVSHAALWYKGLHADIGVPALGGANSVAYSVNARGQAVGIAETTQSDPEDFCGFKAFGVTAAGVSCLPFLWQFGVMTPLPTLGGKNGAAGSINNRGEIAGWAENTVKDPNCPAPLSVQFKPTIWERGNILELPTVANDDVGAVFIINDSGQAAGGTGTCAPLDFVNGINMQPLHAVFWQEGSVIDMGNLGGTGHGFGIFAIDLNSLGQAVGSSDLPGDEISHGFLWSKEKGMQDLGTLPGDIVSGAVAINDAGDIVGTSLDPDFNMRAALWHDGVAHDLNSLIPLDSPFTLLIGGSINSRGEILGMAVQKSVGIVHAFIAVPSTETTPHASAGESERASKPVPLSAEARAILMQSRFGRFVPRKSAVR
jgi:probable HAF family extracellular repeat protein